MYFDFYHVSNELSGWVNQTMNRWPEVIHASINIYESSKIEIVPFYWVFVLQKKSLKKSMTLNWHSIQVDGIEN